jgi:hypothetical protein
MVFPSLMAIRRYSLDLVWPPCPVWLWKECSKVQERWMRKEHRNEQNRRRWTLRNRFVSTTTKDLATLLRQWAFANLWIVKGLPQRRYKGVLHHFTSEASASCRRPRFRSLFLIRARRHRSGLQHLLGRMVHLAQRVCLRKKKNKKKRTL